MKTMRIHLVVIYLLIATTTMAQTTNMAEVPTGGNSWINAAGAASGEKLSNDGWQNWSNGDAVWSTYIKVFKPGTIKLSALLHVPSGKSQLSFSIGTITKTIDVSGIEEKLYPIGTWQINEPGYIKIDAKGISKTGDVFAVVKSFQVEGTAIDSSTAFVKDNKGNMFYWGHRGPSVHIQFVVPTTANDVEWFYNEITVPKGSDPVGSYFMADGFAEGYFGMQVNSATERRVIFSVWSPFATDNPKEIPDDKKIVLVKKGTNVVTQEFGNEGSGGHSHLVYNWKAGETYQFLLCGKPVENNYTNYSAFFFDKTTNKWLLIASFNRPGTTTFLKRLHSFLENFDDKMGNVTRMAYYHNQWVKPANGDWIPINKMTVTADATAAKRYRLDYMGGVENGKFYLKNGGFFNESATLKMPFTVEAPIKKPMIDVESLDK